MPYVIVAILFFGGLLFLYEQIKSFKNDQRKKSFNPIEIRTKIAKWKEKAYVAEIIKNYPEELSNHENLQTKIKHSLFQDELVWLKVNNMEVEILLTFEDARSRDTEVTAHFLFENDEDAINFRLSNV